MKPINQKEMEILIEIQENNKDIIEKEKKINEKIEQVIKED